MQKGNKASAAQTGKMPVWLLAYCRAGSRYVSDLLSDVTQAILPPAGPPWGPSVHRLTTIIINPDHNTGSNYIYLSKLHFKWHCLKMIPNWRIIQLKVTVAPQTNMPTCRTQRRFATVKAMLAHAQLQSASSGSLNAGGTGRLRWRTHAALQHSLPNFQSLCCFSVAQRFGTPLSPSFFGLHFKIWPFF